MVAVCASLSPAPAAAPRNVRELAVKARKNKHVHLKPYQAKDAAKAAKRKPKKQEKPRWGVPDQRRARRR